MTLEELQEEARKDLAITDQERLDTESFKNQKIKSKWLDYRNRYEQLLIKHKANHQKMYREKWDCLLYTSPSPRDKRQSRMPSSA